MQRWPATDGASGLGHNASAVTSFSWFKRVHVHSLLYYQTVPCPAASSFCPCSDVVVISTYLPTRIYRKEMQIFCLLNLLAIILATVLASE